MKHIAHALTIIACFAIALVALSVYVHQAQTPESVRALQEAQRLEWMEQRHEAMLVALWTGAVALAGLLIAAPTWVWVGIRNKRERISFNDGLADIVVKSTGKNQWTTINPNLLATPSGTITVRSGGDTQLSMGRNGFSDADLVAMHSRQQRIQQSQTRARQAGPNKWEVLERNNLLPPPKAPPAPVVAALPPAAPLALVDAVTQSTADRFILGQAGNGQLCAINPRSAVHLAILGASGCGKTVSTGYQLALTAMRSGYQTVILDGKGGMDWSAFAPYTEVHDTDRTTFVDQLRLVSEEYYRRMDLCRRHRVPHISHLRTEDLPPLMVIVEEFGDLLRHMSKAQIAQVDLMLDTIAAKGRAADVHFCLMSQGTEDWSDAVIGATKAKVLYKLAGADAARVADWHAQTLPDVGAFRHNGHNYNAWHVEPMAQKLLATGQGAGVFPKFPALIIDGQCSVVPPVPPEVGDRGRDAQTPPSTGQGTGDRELTEAEIAVIAYYQQHPNASVRDAEAATGVSKSHVARIKKELSL
jgi:hypothetical protein